MAEFDIVDLSQQPIASGQIYQWVGLPGQYDTGACIRVDSLSASGKINAAIVYPAEPAPEIPDASTLISIACADLVTAVEQGWSVLTEVGT